MVIALCTMWSAVLVLTAQRFRLLLQRTSVRRILDRVAGTVITAFGIRLAASSR